MSPMRRDSPKARGWIDLLTASGIDGVTGRVIESWSHAGLLPPDGVSDERRVEHVRQLRAVYRAHPGGADRAALILLARGFPCSGVREAIAREHGAQSLAELAKIARDELAVVVPDPDTDEGSWAVDAKAGQIVDGPSDASMTAGFRRVMAAFLFPMIQRVRSAPLIDPTTGRPEAPEVTVRSGFAQVFAEAAGSCSWTPKPLARMRPEAIYDHAFGQICGTFVDEGLAAGCSAYRHPEQVRMHLGTVPLVTLAAGAALVRFVLETILRQAPRCLQIGPDDIHYQSGFASPIGVAWLGGLLVGVSPGGPPEPDVE